MTASAKETVAEKLRALNPQHLEVRDDSQMHEGHREAKSGAHLRVVVVAAQFAGMPALARHRLVQKTVGDFRAAGLHALQISALAPGEKPQANSPL